MGFSGRFGCECCWPQASPRVLTGEATGTGTCVPENDPHLSPEHHPLPRLHESEDRSGMKDEDVTRQKAENVRSGAWLGKLYTGAACSSPHSHKWRSRLFWGPQRELSGSLPTPRKEYSCHQADSWAKGSQSPRLCPSPPATGRPRGKRIILCFFCGGVTHTASSRAGQDL